MKGPESAGKDIPGNNMEVSDAKVMAIALHLYTAWSGPCIALMRREARGASGGSALALVGFHGDNEKRSRGRGPDMGVALRGSFDCCPLNGALRMGLHRQPDRRQWGGTGRPTDDVLADEGKIRCQGVRGEAMERAVNVLPRPLTEAAPRPALLSEPHPNAPVPHPIAARTTAPSRP